MGKLEDICSVEEIESDGVSLVADVVYPHSPTGLVIFAHGSGSSRTSPRNVWVGRQLNFRGLATLMLDLLTEDEARDRANVFDIPLLAQRLRSAYSWARRHPIFKKVPVGFFGASTGAAGALIAAAQIGSDVKAVVSRGGRPDLARSYLKKVSAPTLLIVGGNDDVVLDLNREIMPLIPHCELRIVPNATHLFEEPGTLEAVAHLSADWFVSQFDSEFRKTFEAAS